MTRIRSSSASSPARSPRATATAWTATSSGTSRTSAAGCARRRQCSGKVCTPVAPHLYRALVQAAYPAIHAADTNAQVLIGAHVLARQSTLHQRELQRCARWPSCARSAAWTPTSRSSRTGRCKGFKAVAGGRVRVPPARRARRAGERRSRNADDISHRRALDADRARSTSCARSSGIKSAKQARPLHRRVRLPDQPARPCSPASRSTTQDDWLQRAAYQAWRNPRVKLFAQYLWKDEPRSLNDEFGGWQSGLRFADGRSEAVAEALRDAVRDRRRPRAPVGAGAHARRDAASRSQRRLRGQLDVADDRHPQDRLARATGAGARGCSRGASYRFLAAGRDQRDAEAQVDVARGLSRTRPIKLRACGRSKRCGRDVRAVGRGDARAGRRGGGRARRPRARRHRRGGVRARGGGDAAGDRPLGLRARDRRRRSRRSRSPPALPVTDAARERRTIAIDSRAELERRYPALVAAARRRRCARCRCSAGDEVLGAVGVSRADARRVLRRRAASCWRRSARRAGRRSSARGSTSALHAACRRRPRRWRGR